MHCSNAMRYTRCGRCSLNCASGVTQNTCLSCAGCMLCILKHLHLSASGSMHCGHANALWQTFVPFGTVCLLEKFGVRSACAFSCCWYALLPHPTCCRKCMTQAKAPGRCRGGRPDPRLGDPMMQARLACGQKICDFQQYHLDPAGKGAGRCPGGGFDPGLGDPAVQGAARDERRRAAHHGGVRQMGR